MSSLVALPVIAPLATALFTLFVPRPSFARRLIVGLVLAGSLALSVALIGHVRVAGPLALSVGDWLVPFGIVLVVDTLSAVMLSLSALTGLACVLYGFAETDLADEHPLRLPLLLLLIAGIQLSFVTGDLFNLFVSFEVFLLASYGLMTLDLDVRSSRRALPYVTINIFGSVLFLCVCAFCYGLLGTLNFAEMAVRSTAMLGDPRLTALGALLLLVVALKAGLFPLYYWLPISYPVLPPALAAFYAGMLTKVGVYVLIRLFGTILPPELTGLHAFICWAAGLTMVIGVLGAVAQNQIQTILSYHIVSQVGYMALAIGLFSRYAFTAAIFYVIHHIVVKSGLFLVGGVILRVRGSDHLAKVGGLWGTASGLGVTFLLLAFSLSGIPPFSGFWGKLMIVQEGLAQGQWVLVMLSLLASILTLVSMLKIWMLAFWSGSPAQVPRFPQASSRGMTGVAGALTAVSLCIGLGANYVVGVAEYAARETLDRATYVRNVQALNLQRKER